MKNTSSSRLLVLVPLLSFLVGCSHAEPTHNAVASTNQAAAVAGVTPLAAADRSLIVTIDTSVTVDNVDDASSRLRAEVERAGGFIADSRTSGTDGQLTAHLELRVPAEQARSVRRTIRELGTVTDSTEKVEDVTEQRADLEARLRNARTQEKRLLQLMSERTSSISDLLAAEKEVARIRENIERLEAQELGMKSRSQLATVRVTLVPKNIPAWQTPGTSVVRAGKSGVEAAQALSVCLAMLMAAVGPTVLPILAIIAGIVFVLRRRRANATIAMVG